MLLLYLVCRNGDLDRLRLGEEECDFDRLDFFVGLFTGFSSFFSLLALTSSPNEVIYSILFFCLLDPAHSASLSSDEDDELLLLDEPESGERSSRHQASIRYGIVK